MSIKKRGKSGHLALLHSLKPAFHTLQKSDPLRMAGATAFFTSFALPPIVFILTQLIGFFAGRRTVGRALMDRIAGTLGNDAATQVRQVLRSIVGFHESWYVLVIGFIFLLFIATTLFNVIRNSLNDLWFVKITERPGLLYILSTRARSLGLLLIAGILFLADMLSESLRMVAGKYIRVAWAEGAVYLDGILNELVGLVVICTWFTFLFRFLGDGRPRWKPAIAGGILTALLFKAGKMLLWILLVNSDIGKLYGASGSLVLVLLFVFYSSFIFYYGACFVDAYSRELGLAIHPIEKAYHYKTEEVEEKIPITRK